jgi:hypothetical protein
MKLVTFAVTQNGEYGKYKGFGLQTPPVEPRTGPKKFLSFR